MNWGHGLWLGAISGAIVAGVQVLGLRLLITAYEHMSSFMSIEVMQVMQKYEEGNVGDRLISRQALAFLLSKPLEQQQLLGVGGIATVYKGLLSNGVFVAIKRVSIEREEMQGLTSSHTGTFGSFKTMSWRSNPSASSAAWSHTMSEMATLGEISHCNLVRLYAYARKPDAHLLIYEFAPNGSLKDALADVRRGNMFMPWSTRKSIALGVARGLSYLHTECEPRILHRDLKTSNILLDKDFAPRVSDFGLARKIPEGKEHLTVSHVAGTVGYIAPEYSNTGKFSTASDVYSLGIVFGVLLSGREPRDEFFGDIQGGMLGWLNYAVKIEEEHRAVDRELLGEISSMEEMRLLMRLACYCTQSKPSDRPSCRNIVAIFENYGWGSC